MTDPRAGQPAAAEDLVDVAKLVTAYYALHPDPGDPVQRVSFGTSGHRGSALTATFNEDHILATTQAICEYRAEQGYDGPLFIGRDTHGLSEPAWAVARAAEISAEMADGIEALGVNIVGDLASLGKLPEDGPDLAADGRDLAADGRDLAADGRDLAADDGSAPPMVPVEAAVRATIGAFIAGGAGGQTAEEIVRDLDTRSLAKVLADRCRRRVRRALPG